MRSILAEHEDALADAAGRPREMVARLTAAEYDWPHAPTLTLLQREVAEHQDADVEATDRAGEMAARSRVY